MDTKKTLTLISVFNLILITISMSLHVASILVNSMTASAGNVIALGLAVHCKHSILFFLPDIVELYFFYRRFVGCDVTQVNLNRQGNQ